MDFLHCLLFQEVSYQYWPVHSSVKFGEYTVELLDEERREGFVVRTLSVNSAVVSSPPLLAT